VTGVSAIGATSLLISHFLPVTRSHPSATTTQSRSTQADNLALAHRVCNGGPPGPISYAKCTLEQVATLEAVVAALSRRAATTPALG
jgi:hypothetical protein